jgi:hypothetical protein
LPEVWHFKVPSGTKPGIKYDVYVRFRNLEEMIKKYAPDKRLWNKARTTVDLRLLASEIMNSIDIETDCACPADLYWGPEYIKTQRQAQYDHEENRPPDIRNPHQYGALCKHGQLVFEVLPMYLGTFASFLKEYWIDVIENAVEAGTAEFGDIQRAARELGRREEEEIAKRGRPGRGAEERPKGEAEEEIPVAEPGDEEEIPTAEPMEGPELGGEEEPKASRSGKKVTKRATKDTNKRTPTSTRPGTKSVSGASNKTTKPNTKKGTK